jgi:hypothetical protein
LIIVRAVTVVPSTEMSVSSVAPASPVRVIVPVHAPFEPAIVKVPGLAVPSGRIAV